MHEQQRSGCAGEETGGDLSDVKQVGGSNTPQSRARTNYGSAGDLGPDG